MKNTVSAIAMSLGGFVLVGGLVFTFTMLGLVRPGLRSSPYRALRSPLPRTALPRTQKAMARLKANASS